MACVQLDLDWPCVEMGTARRSIVTCLLWSAPVPVQGGQLGGWERGVASVGMPMFASRFYCCVLHFVVWSCDPRVGLICACAHWSRWTLAESHQCSMWSRLLCLAKRKTGQPTVNEQPITEKQLPGTPQTQSHILGPWHNGPTNYGPCNIWLF